MQAEAMANPPLSPGVGGRKFGNPNMRQSGLGRQQERDQETIQALQVWGVWGLWGGMNLQV